MWKGQYLKKRGGCSGRGIFGYNSINGSNFKLATDNCEIFSS